MNRNRRRNDRNGWTLMMERKRVSRTCIKDGEL